MHMGYYVLGAIVLLILYTVIRMIPDLVRYMKISSM